MPRGSQPGERRGGRRKGTPNRATVKRREVAARALEEGITPLEVLLRTMRALWAAAEGPRGVLALDIAKEAAEIAKDAAPYVHPRLASVVTKSDPTYNPWKELLDIAAQAPRGLPWEVSKTLAAQRAAQGR